MARRRTSASTLLLGLMLGLRLGWTLGLTAGNSRGVSAVGETWRDGDPLEGEP
jgi:ABC-type nitrate/sulfonate/bicarbonate transport system permease component